MVRLEGTNYDSGNFIDKLKTWGVFGLVKEKERDVGFFFWILAVVFCRVHKFKLGKKQDSLS